MASEKIVKLSAITAEILKGHAKIISPREEGRGGGIFRNFLFLGGNV